MFLGFIHKFIRSSIRSGSGICEGRGLGGTKFCLFLDRGGIGSVHHDAGLGKSLHAFVVHAESLSQFLVLLLLFLPDVVGQLQDLLEVHHELLHQVVVVGVEGEKSIADLQLKYVLAVPTGAPIHIGIYFKDGLLDEIYLALAVGDGHGHHVLVHTLDVSQHHLVDGVLLGSLRVFGIGQGR